jgi:hypothetical protein
MLLYYEDSITKYRRPLIGVLHSLSAILLSVDCLSCVTKFIFLFLSIQNQTNDLEAGRYVVPYFKAPLF